MRKIFVAVLALVSMSTYAKDLRQEFTQAQPLESLDSLKTFEIRDKFGALKAEGGKWTCKGSFKKLAFVPLTSKRWWSPNTSAEIIQLRDGKVTGLSSTSTKEMTFRVAGNDLVIEFSTGTHFRNSEVSVENSERFATGYTKCSPVKNP